MINFREGFIHQSRSANTLYSVPNSQKFIHEVYLGFHSATQIATENREPGSMIVF